MMDRRLLLEFVHVTETAAIACAASTGRGDREAADALAVEAMRKAFDRVPVRGTVVIGEGERDEAPMLYIGEVVGPMGNGLPEVDIAVDPLEGTNLCATASPGALAVLAAAPRGTLLNAPDTYMEKIAAGPEARGIVSLRRSATENIHALAEAKGCRTEDLTVVILERPRHEALVAEVRRTGARIQLLTDGDVAPSVATCLPGGGVDLVLGTGGAPEGVLAAAALTCLGGEFVGRLSYRNPAERERAIAMGIGDPDRILERSDLVRGDVMFVASGVTDGPVVRGVRRSERKVVVHTLALESAGGAVRFIEASYPDRAIG